MGNITSVWRKKTHILNYDRWLKRFKYRETIEAALISRKPDFVITAVTELLRRGNLNEAFRDMTSTSFDSLLDFFYKYLTNNKYIHINIQALSQLLNVIIENIVLVKSAIQKLLLIKHKIFCELRMIEKLLTIKGLMETMFISSNTP